MNILGMGSFELLIVLLVAFIFLGPSKMIETAKNIGKLLKNAKDMARDMQEIIIDEENSNSKDDQLDTPNSKNINDLNPVKFNTNDQEIKTIPKNDIENEDNKIE